MTTSHAIDRRASELLAAARAFQSDAEASGSHAAAPDALESLEEALQVLSAGWYQLAADAVPRAVDSREHSPDPRTLPREAEVHLLGTLHDIAAGFARCARTCREGRQLAAPVIARAMATQRADDGEPEDSRRSSGDAPTIGCAA
jgi:hypothetical protein